MSTVSPTEVHYHSLEKDQPQRVSNNSPLPVAFSPNTANLDAFARLRVSEPETLFDSKQIHSKAPLFWDELITGAAAGTWSQSGASTIMDVDASTNESIIRQTFQRFNYQPGKSQLALITGTLLKTATGGAGLERGVGLGDERNGFFLVDSDGEIIIRRRTATTGSTVDIDVAQSDWNLDKMNGSGASKITMDFSKSMIFLIDMEWLGVGRVRIGFVIDGTPYYVHQFMWANNEQGVYMSTPNLPVRYWIANDGNYASAAEIEHICSSVMSEGGTQENGPLRSASTGPVASLANTALYAIVGFKLKAGNYDASVILKKIAMIASTSNDQAQWRLMWNPTIAGVFTYSDETDSVVQVAKATDNTNTVTNGHQVDSDFFSTATPTSNAIDNSLKLGANIAKDDFDELVLCCAPITSNITVRGSITWRENS